MGGTFLEISSGETLARYVMKGGRKERDRQNVQGTGQVEWESTKYKGKRPCARFAQLFVHFL